MCEKERKKERKSLFTLVLIVKCVYDLHFHLSAQCTHTQKCYIGGLSNLAFSSKSLIDIIYMTRVNLNVQWHLMLTNIKNTLNTCVYDELISRSEGQLMVLKRRSHVTVLQSLITKTVKQMLLLCLMLRPVEWSRNDTLAIIWKIRLWPQVNSPERIAKGTHIYFSFKYKKYWKD